MTSPIRDPAWAAFPETRLELGPGVPQAPELRIDLREAPGPALRHALRRVGLAGEFAVVTPCNPHGRRLDPSANAERFERMRLELERDGVRWLRADGVAADGRHREPGFAVQLAREAAAALAVRWEQLALFWFDGESFWILPAMSDHPPVRLPLSDRGC